jgi:hypothetical protein
VIHKKNKKKEEEEKRSSFILFSMIDRYRQYGLWERYADLYPDGDLVYIVGVSDYKKDWFFAQVTRYNSSHVDFVLSLE